MRKLSTKSIQITKISGQKSAVASDFAAIEEPLEISITLKSAQPEICNKNISITMRTPGADKDLALGFLFTEGIINSFSQIENVIQSTNNINIQLKNSSALDLSKLERHFYTSSSCGVCGKSSIVAIKTVRQIKVDITTFTVPKATIYSLPLKLREQQKVFETTGGLHAAALFNQNGNLSILREDVGRHNALDKLIGAALQENTIPLSNQLLLLSGRISFELVQKAAMAGIQFIMAIGAPSSLAIELAKEFNITLIGFLNTERFNIYTGEEKVENRTFE